MLKEAKSFICRGCVNPVTSAGRTSVDIGASAKLELVDKFCYLGDMLSVDGDADAAVEARIRIGCNKFRQLVPLLTNKDVSLIMRGRLYSSCVHTSVLHRSETWPVSILVEIFGRSPYSSSIVTFSLQLIFSAFLSILV